MSLPAPPTERTHTVLDSPYGPLTLVAEGDRLVGLYMEAQRHRPDESAFGERVPAPAGPRGGDDPFAPAPFAQTPGGEAPFDAAPFDAAARQLEEYFAGRRTHFDLPLTLHGTAFQQRVWAALREIPYGETWTYGELALHIGRPTASRAVGLANGKNPLGVIVPCHRVVGSDGGLTGYGGGLHRKQALLEHERALPGALPGTSPRVAG